VRFFFALIAFFTCSTAYAQIDGVTSTPGSVIEYGLVPPSVGGCWNSPSLTVTIPTGKLFGSAPTEFNYNPGQILTSFSISVPASTYTYLPVSNTYVWVGLNGAIAYTNNNIPPNGFYTLLYLVGTEKCLPDNHDAIAYMCGYIAQEGGGYANWEGAENQRCYNIGPPISTGAAQFRGNGLGIVSEDPTTFLAEGIGNGALEVNPQLYTIRQVLNRPPMVNDYISQFGMYGQCAENYAQGVGCQYGSIITRIRDPNAATRDAEMDLATADPGNTNGTGTFPRLSLTGHGIACADVRGPSAGAFTASRTIACDDFLIEGQSLKAMLIAAGIMH
jgi:hypothetical protein